jgi:glutathione gamma-glutamylcysteinyltransferase
MTWVGFVTCRRFVADVVHDIYIKPFGGMKRLILIGCFLFGLPVSHCSAFSVMMKEADCNCRSKQKNDRESNSGSPLAGITPVQATPTSSVSAAPLSLYRRPLPPSSVALSSSKGRSMFASALEHGGLKCFFRLVEQHSTQSDPAFCGPATLLIILNTFAVDPRQQWKGPWRWYHDETSLNCCLDMDYVKQHGVTLKDFQCLAICQGVQTQVHYVQRLDENETIDTAHRASLQDFRQAVRDVCCDDGTLTSDNENFDSTDDLLSKLLVVSYSRQVLGQTGSGHFSPIAAYDAVTDSVLILDTARFKYGAHWIALPLLYEALRPVDSATGETRGYVMMTYDGEDESDNSSKSESSSDSSTISRITLPCSILFRSKQKQNSARRSYLKFLDQLRHDQQIHGQDHLLRWLDVLNYWTDGGSQPQKVFSILEPRLKGIPGTELSENGKNSEGLASNVRHLIARLITLIESRQQVLQANTISNQQLVETLCRTNRNRTMDILPIEAIFVVYLASHNPNRRSTFVLSESKSDSNSVEPEESIETKEQLLAEAELVALALAMSVEQE